VYHSSPRGQLNQKGTYGEFNVLDDSWFGVFWGGKIALTFASAVLSGQGERGQTGCLSESNLRGVER
jgi:hypothetical protein